LPTRLNILHVCLSAVAAAGCLGPASQNADGANDISGATGGASSTSGGTASQSTVAGLGGTSGSPQPAGAAGAAGASQPGGSGATATSAGLGGSGGQTSAGGNSTTVTFVATGGSETRDASPAFGGTSLSGGANTGGVAGTAGAAGIAGAVGTSGTAGTPKTGGTAGPPGVPGTTGTSGTGGIAGTGGTSASSAAANVAEVSVDFGLPGVGYLNGLFATITICVPGTSQCQTIDHVLVDTGSSGLRLLGSILTLGLPAWTNSSGVALAECSQFVSAFIWGPLRTADLKVAGERANGLAVQIIDGSTYPVPSNCTGINASSAATLGSNGILGVGSFREDCGSACAAVPGSRSVNPGIYYACSSTAKGGCQATAVPVSKQVSNPVSLFSQDNNGTIIALSAIPANGAPSVAGSLVFGIGTQANNGLGNETVLPLDGTGTFMTRYPTNGSSSPAFVDSGSNAIYFLNSGTTRIPACPAPYPMFYCPVSTLSLSATNQATDGSVTVGVNFSIANADALFGSQTNVAFDNLGGPSAAPQSGAKGTASYFDWGLPFYFGRRVFTAVEGQSTSAGTGPFVAF